MNKTLLKFTSLVAFCLTVTLATAQSLSIDKVYEVSKRAKWGSITDINIDESNNDIEITYFTKRKENAWGSLKEMQFEVYHFDLDFNFKNMEDLVIDYVTARYRFKGFKFRGETYETEGITVASMTPLLTLKRKLTTYKWDWFAGSYRKTVKLLDKVKLTDENDNKLYRHIEFEGDSTLSLIATGGNDQGGSTFHLMTVDLKLNITQRSKIDMPYICTMNNGTRVTEIVNGEEKEYYIGLIQPISMKGGTVAQNALKCNLVCIDLGTMTVIRNIPFETPFAGYRVESVLKNGDNIYLTGKLSDTKDFAKLAKAFVYDYSDKSSSLHTMKFGVDKVLYATTLSPEQLTSKISVVPGVKGKAQVNAFLRYKDVKVINDELFINAQNYSAANSVQVMGNSGAKSKDIILMHISKTGELINNYVYPFDGELSSTIYPNEDKTSIYWTVLDYDSKVKDGILYTYAPFLRVSKLDIAAKKPGPLVSLDGKDIRLSLQTPVFPLSFKNSVSFFGTKDNKGNLWFGRMELK